MKKLKMIGQYVKGVASLFISGAILTGITLGGVFVIGLLLKMLVTAFQWGYHLI